MNDFQRLKKHVSIVELLIYEWYKVRKISENNYESLCVNPDHDDSSPSLKIDIPNSRTKCFSCGFWWDIFDIISKIHGWLSNKESLDYIRNIEPNVNQGRLRESIFIPQLKESYNNLWKDKVQYQDIMLYIAKYWFEQLPNYIRDTYLISNQQIKYIWENWIMEYSQWYGLTKKIAKQYLLGYSENSKTLYKKLQSIFPTEVIQSTRLFDTRGLPKFKNRIVIPYIIDKKVVYFTARKTEYTPVNKYEIAKYKNQGIQNIYLYNEKDIYNECIFITEWAFDCLALKNIWYNSVALWWIHGITKLSNSYPKLKNVTLIYICLDNDWGPEWIWNKQAILLKEKLQKENIQSHIITLPLLGREKMDINEYLSIKSKKEFNKLLTF